MRSPAARRAALIAAVLLLATATACGATPSGDGSLVPGTSGTDGAEDLVTDPAPWTAERIMLTNVGAEDSADPGISWTDATTTRSIVMAPVLPGDERCPNR